MAIEIRSYNPGDYEGLRDLYVSTGWYDETIDSEEVINAQVEADKDSVLIAEQDGSFIGTVTLLFTGRMGLFFRLLAGNDNAEVKNQLLERGEDIFARKGYKRVDIVAPDGDMNRYQEYEANGFTKGSGYRWFWKEIQK